MAAGSIVRRMDVLPLVVLKKRWPWNEKCSGEGKVRETNFERSREVIEKLEARK